MTTWTDSFTAMLDVLPRCELLEPADLGEFTRPFYATLKVFPGTGDKVHRVLLQVGGEPPKAVQWVVRESRVSGCPTAAQKHFHVCLMGDRCRAKMVGDETEGVAEVEF